MSQLDGETREIDGCTYTVYMLGPMVSHDLLVDVSKMIGPALGPVLDVLLPGAALGKDLSKLELDAGFFSRAASSLFSGLDKATLKSVINTLAEVTHANGKPLKPIFEIHFRGRLHVMYQWLAFAMEVQWGKCFSALGSVVQARGAMMGAESPSPST